MAELPVVDRLRLLIRSRIRAPFDRHVRTPLRRLQYAKREYRPVFVAGASGSGTSLLAVALGQRFECAGVVYELDAQLSERSFLAVPPLDTFVDVSAYLDRLRPADSWSVESAREALLDVFRSCTDGESEAIVAKGPDMNLLRVRFLAQCFPTAHFVLVFRDPVANIEGLRRKWRIFGESPLAESIRFYAESHEAFMADAAGIADQVTAVEYEALAANTDAVLDRIAARCGLTLATTQRKLQTRPNLAGKGLRNVRKSSVGVVKDANQEALERMQGGDAYEIRAALSPLHDRLRNAPYSV